MSYFLRQLESGSYNVNATIREANVLLSQGTNCVCVWGGGGGGGGVGRGLVSVPCCPFIDAITQTPNLRPTI